MSTPTGKYAAKDWDKVRMEFHTSIMVDTSLNSLAQNLDGASWPLTGDDETPGKYIDLNFDELRCYPGLSNHPERIDQLVDILADTLAFDNPFGEMVAQSAAAEAAENPLLKNLVRLGIPANYPIDASLLSADGKAFCRLEKIATLADFAEFAQNMPPQVVVGGDFRTLLNALAHVNESSLATLLPFRPGSKGLHLPEALGQVIDALPPRERLAVLRRYGVRLTDSEVSQADGVSRERLAQVEQDVAQRVQLLFDFFKAEISALPATVKESGSLARYLVVLGNPGKEMFVAKLLEPMAKAPEPAATPAGPQRKKGLWATLFGWLGR